MIDLIVKVFNTDFPDYKLKLVALAIARRCGNEDGLCWASQSRLAKDCSMSRKTAMKYIGKLEEVGAIKRVKRKPNGSQYRSDLISLTLDAVTLPASGVKQPPVEEMDDQMLLDFMLGDSDVENSEESPVPDRSPVPAGDTDESLSGTRSPVPAGDTKKPSQETKEETPDPEPPWPVDDDGILSLRLAANYLFWMATDNSRARSSVDQLHDALEDLFNDLPSGFQPAVWFANLVKGTKAYMSSDSALNDGGRYVFGVHKLYAQKKFWDVWVPMGAKADQKDLDPNDKWRGLIRSWQRSLADPQSSTPFWVESHGHPPDHFARRIPLSVLQEFGLDGVDTIRASAFRALDMHQLGRWREGAQGWGPKPGEKHCFIPTSLIKEWEKERSDSGDDAAFA